MSGSETETDDEDDNNYQKHLLLKNAEKETNNGSSRRSKRRRSSNQLWDVQKVPANGHCLYHAMLRATRDKGLLPGSKFLDERDKKDVLQLRKGMVKYLERGEGDIIQNLRDVNIDGQTLYDIVLNRIQAGYNGDKLVQKMSYENWARNQEIEIMKTLYDIDIAILSKKAALDGVIGNTIIKPFTTVLVYSNGNHWEWAKLKVDWEDFKRSRTNTLLKF